jgi:hypothetical protein
MVEDPIQFLEREFVLTYKEQGIVSQVFGLAAAYFMTEYPTEELPLWLRKLAEAYYESRTFPEWDDRVYDIYTLLQADRSWDNPKREL